MRIMKLLFVLTALVLISGCALVHNNKITLRNLTIIETANETNTTNTAEIEAFNGNNYLLNCSLIITQDNISSEQNIGEFMAFESRNISADVAFPEGNATVKFSLECTRI